MTFRLLGARLLVVLLTLLISPKAFSTLRVNGYGSLVATHTDYEGIYDGWYSKGFDYDGGSNIAFNFNKDLGPKFQLNTQLLARGRNEFLPDVRLAHLNWFAHEDLMVRVGKIRFPLWLLSEYQEVGVLLPWSRLPTEVYFTPFSTLTGFSAKYRYDFWGTLRGELELYGGGGEQSLATKTFEVDGNQNDLIGLNIGFRNSNHYFRLGAAQSDYVGELVIPTEGNSSDFGGALDTNEELVFDFKLERAEFLSAGYRFDNSRALVLAEYVSVSRLDEGSRQTFVEAHYITLGFYFSDYLLHVTRSRLDETNTGIREGTPSSHAIGLNWLYSNDLVFKFDYTVAEEPSTTSFTSSDIPASRVSILDLSMSFAF